MIFKNKAGRLIYALHLMQRVRGRRGPVAQLQRLWGKIVYHLYSIITASDIGLDAEISPKTRFLHMTGLVIHPDATIEDDCLIMQQVTLGVRDGPGAPHVCRGAFVGAGAKILGPVTIGEYAKIGANAVVLEDVPAYATAVGIPARVIRQRLAGEPGADDEIARTAAATGSVDSPRSPRIPGTEAKAVARHHRDEEEAVPSFQPH
jgi:serine O-acetyltransferase